MSDLEKIKQLEQKIISLEKELKDLTKFIDDIHRHDHFKFEELEANDHKLLDLIEEITSKDAKWIKKAGIKQNK